MHKAFATRDHLFQSHQQFDLPSLDLSMDVLQFLVSMAILKSQKLRGCSLSVSGGMPSSSSLTRRQTSGATLRKSAR